MTSPCTAHHSPCSGARQARASLKVALNHSLCSGSGHAPRGFTSLRKNTLAPPCTRAQRVVHGAGGESNPHGSLGQSLAPQGGQPPRSLARLSWLDEVVNPVRSLPPTTGGVPPPIPLPVWV